LVSTNDDGNRWRRSHTLDAFWAWMMMMMMMMMIRNGSMFGAEVTMGPT